MENFSFSVREDILLTGFVNYRGGRGPRAVDSACTWGPHGSRTQCLGVHAGLWWGNRVRANGWTPPPREGQTLSGRGQSHAHDLKGSAVSLSQQLWDSWSTDLSTKSSWEKHSTQGQFCGPPLVLSMGNCGMFNPDGPQDCDIQLNGMPSSHAWGGSKALKALARGHGHQVTLFCNFVS